MLEKPFKEVMDSCFNCKLCLSECPSQVDIRPGHGGAARVRREARDAAPQLGAGESSKVAQVASIAPGLVNAAIGNPVERAARESVGKIAPSRFPPSVPPVVPRRRSGRSRSR